MNRKLLNPGWWQGLRHRRGFGIHSPFAYRFITEALNPSRGYRYYAEDYAEDRTRRIVARLEGFFGVRRTVWVNSEGIDAGELAESGLVVVDLRKGCPEAVLERVRKGEVVVLALHHGKGRLLPLLKAMPHGMSFRNRSTRAVLVCTKKLPRQDFGVAW